MSSGTLNSTIPYIGVLVLLLSQASYSFFIFFGPVVAINSLERTAAFFFVNVAELTDFLTILVCLIGC